MGKNGLFIVLVVIMALVNVVFWTQVLLAHRRQKAAPQKVAIDWLAAQEAE